MVPSTDAKTPGRILVVDDDRLVRTLHADALLAEGHTVLTADDGEAALRHVRDQRFDVVVTDILMPGIDGLELLDLAKRAQPDLEVIVLTSVDSVETAVRALRAGAWHYLLKPVNPEALRLGVQRCLERRLLLRAHRQLERHGALFELSQRVTATLEAERLFPMAVDALRGAAEADVALLCELTDDALRVVGARGLTDTHAQWLATTVHGAFGRILAEAAAPTPLDGLSALIPSRDTRLRSLDRGLLVPLDEGERRLGAALLLRNAEGGPFREEQITDLQFLGRCVALAMRNARRYDAAQERAYLDQLTGLGNAALLEQRLDLELARRQADRAPISLLFMDLDHFKLVNDRHGHQVGSQVLAEAGRMLRRHVREHDLLVRYGGDEFVALLLDSDVGDALRVAERMRRAVEQHRFLAREGLDLRLTLCIGAAAWPRDAEDKLGLLRGADVAMYHGKRNRRNAVYAFDEVDTPPPIRSRWE